MEKRTKSCVWKSVEDILRNWMVCVVVVPEWDIGKSGVYSLQFMSISVALLHGCGSHRIQIQNTNAMQQRIVIIAIIMPTINSMAMIVCNFVFFFFLSSFLHFFFYCLLLLHCICICIWMCVAEYGRKRYGFLIFGLCYGLWLRWVVLLLWALLFLPRPLYASFSLSLSSVFVRGGKA